MERSALRARICWALVGTHLFAIFFTAFTVGMRNAMDALNLILIITPLTGAYLMIIVQYFVNEDVSVADTVVIGKTAANLFTVLTIAFGFALVGLLACVGTPYLDLDQIKFGVGVVETVLGVYVSLFVKMLFGGSGAAKPARRRAKAKPSG